MNDTEDIEDIEDSGSSGEEESTPRSWFYRDRDVADAKRKAMYQRHKDRPSIKKINEELGLSDDLYPVMASLEEMDAVLEDGGTFSDILYRVRLPRPSPLAVASADWFSPEIFCVSQEGWEQARLALPGA